MGLFGKPKKTSKAVDNKIESSISKSRNDKACPSCGTILDPPPKRKKQCPECKEEIFVRTKQEIFNSNLLKEDQALAIDFFQDLVNYGATVKDYKDIEKSLKQRWGFNPAPYDVVWSLSNTLIARGPEDLNKSYDKKRTLLHYAKMVTFSQALYQLKRGVDPSSYMSTVANYEIDMHVGTGLNITQMEVLSDGCCDNCKKLNGKKFDIEGLKKRRVLPIKSCTNKLNNEDKFSWCACMFLPVIAR